MNPYSTPDAAGSAAVAIVYPHQGPPLRVPLGRASQGGPPEQQLMRWFQQRAAAEPGFPRQVKSILLITNEPLCPTCQQAVRRFLQPFGLEARLRLQARQAAPATCGCRHSGAASPTPTVLDELLSAEVAAEFEAEILTEEQKKALQRIVVAEAEQLRQNLYGTKSKPGRSGDPVKAQVNRNVGLA